MLPMLVDRHTGRVHVSAAKDTPVVAMSRLVNKVSHKALRAGKAEFIVDRTFWNEVTKALPDPDLCVFRGIRVCITS